MDHPTTKSSTLVRIEVMTAKFTTSDSADRMDEIGPVQIFESVLIRVVGVGATIEVIGRRVLPTFLVTCIL